MAQNQFDELISALDSQYQNALDSIREKIDVLILSANASEKQIEAALIKGYQSHSESFEKFYDDTFNSLNESILKYPNQSNALVDELESKILATAHLSAETAYNTLTSISQTVSEPLSAVLQDILANVSAIESTITDAATQIDNSAMLLRAEVLETIQQNIGVQVGKFEEEQQQTEQSLWDTLTGWVREDEQEYFDISAQAMNSLETIVDEHEEETNGFFGPMFSLFEGIGDLVAGLKESISDSVSRSTLDLIKANKELQTSATLPQFGDQGDLFKAVVESVLGPMETAIAGGINIEEREVPEKPSQLDLGQLNTPLEGGIPLLGMLAGGVVMMLVLPTISESLSAFFRPMNEALGQKTNMWWPTTRMDPSTLITLLQRDWFSGHSQDLDTDFEWLGGGDRKTEAQNDKINGASFLGMTEELRKQGYNRQQISAFASLAESFIGIYDLIRLWNVYQDGAATKIDGEEFVVTEAEVDERLGTEGYSEQTADWIKRSRWIWPSVQDVVRFAIRDVWEPDVVKAMGTDTDPPKEFYTWAKRAGVNEASAKLYWTAHYELPPYLVMVRGARRQLFKHLDVVYDDEGYPDKEAYAKVWENWEKAADITPTLGEALYRNMVWQNITRVDIRRLDRLGLIGDGTGYPADMPKPEKFIAGVSRDQELKRLYQAAGYNPEDKGDAEKMVEFTKTLTANSIKPQASSSEKGVTLGVLNTLFRLGDMDQTDYEKALGTLNYSAEAINYNVDKLLLQKRIDDQSDDLDELKGIARIGGDYDALLGEYIAEYINENITEQDILRGRLEKLASSVTKQPTVAQLDELAETGNITAKEYRDALTSQGYSEDIVNAFSNKLLGLGVGIDFRGFATEMEVPISAGIEITYSNYRELWKRKPTVYTQGEPVTEDDSSELPGGL